MKRIFALIILIFMLTSCTVQPEMSPELFVERLLEGNETLTADKENSFYSGEEFICFISNNGKENYVLKVSSDERSNANKICLVSDNIKNKQSFVSVAKSIIKVFACEDESEKILTALFSENAENFRFYETHRFSYSAYSDSDYAFFSAENKTLSQQDEIGLTLKDYADNQ